MGVLLRAVALDPVRRESVLGEQAIYDLPRSRSALAIHEPRARTGNVGEAGELQRVAVRHDQPLLAIDETHKTVARRPQRPFQSITVAADRQVKSRNVGSAARVERETVRAAAKRDFRQESGRNRHPFAELGEQRVVACGEPQRYRGRARRSTGCDLEARAKRLHLAPQPLVGVEQIHAEPRQPGAATALQLCERRTQQRLRVQQQSPCGTVRDAGIDGCRAQGRMAPKRP